MRAGRVPVSAKGSRWVLTTAVAPTTRAVDVAPADLAAMIGVDADDVAEGPLWVDTGVEQLILPLRSVEAVRRARVDARLLRAARRVEPRGGAGLPLGADRRRDRRGAAVLHPGRGRDRGPGDRFGLREPRRLVARPGRAGDPSRRAAGRRRAPAVRAAPRGRRRRRHPRRRHRPRARRGRPRPLGPPPPAPSRPSARRQAGSGGPGWKQVQYPAGRGCGVTTTSAGCGSDGDGEAQTTPRTTRHQVNSPSTTVQPRTRSRRIPAALPNVKVVTATTVVGAGVKHVGASPRRHQGQP